MVRGNPARSTNGLKERCQRKKNSVQVTTGAFWEREIKSFKATMVGEEEFPGMEDLAALKGVIQYPSRLKRATLAWTAFQRGLESEK